ncbi:hypothetical protein VTK73DRAFT_5744 [Phialemonium thermophilum]|uniref:Uncharacterized protein n=1 Tax=Phialemonium thermophilum TaxID=223376 RepID=A0ABR3V0T7_9PEZI
MAASTKGVGALREVVRSRWKDPCRRSSGLRGEPQLSISLKVAFPFLATRRYHEIMYGHDYRGPSAVLECPGLIVESWMPPYVVIAWPRPA